MNKLDLDYQNLLKDILENGNKKQTRNGDTISVFGRQIRHDMKDGFPLLTTKKMPWKSIVTELLWFLRGDTNIKYLVDNGCNIWNGDTYKNYIFNSEWFPISSVNGGFIGTKTGSDEIMTQTIFIDKIKTDDEFAKQWGELGPIYGKQWRSWGKKNVINYDLENVKSSDKVKVMDLIRDGGDYSKYDVKVTYQNNSIDQIQNLINDLKTNPDSRRLMVNAWNVGELDQMVLPPCHYGFQVYTRELSLEERNKWSWDNWGITCEMESVLDEQEVPKRAMSLMWNQRSVDTFLGLPFNIASYGLLLEILAKEVNMVPEELIGNLGDVHLYSNHIDAAKEQIGREGFDLPTLRFSPCPITGIDMEYQSIAQFQIDNYQSHPTIKAPLSN
jgi:thymidylate synthase